MADFTALKNSIRNYIKQNGNAEITGEVLQNILISMVVSMGDGAINGIADGLANEGNARTNADGLLQNAINSISTALGDGYTYAGIATPATTPTSGRVFYLALQAGTYTNFGGIVVTQGINILKNNDGTWQLDNVIGIDDIPTAGSPNLVKSGGAFANMGAFDISDYNKSGSTLATYADLTAALAALPSEYQKGGMSVKFVQSSDNKYIQYFLTKDEWSIGPNDWEKMNLEEEVSQLGQNIDECRDDINTLVGGDIKITTKQVAGNFASVGKLLLSNGSTASFSNYNTSGFISLEDSEKEFVSLEVVAAMLAGSNAGGISFYSTNDVGGFISSINSVGTTTTDNEKYVVDSLPTGAKYFRVCALNNAQTEGYLKLVQKAYTDGEISSINAEIVDIKSQLPKLSELEKNGEIDVINYGLAVDIYVNKIIENGVVVPDIIEKRNCTSLVKLDRNKNLYANTSGSVVVSFYDSSKQYISSTTAETDIYYGHPLDKSQYPANAVYVAFTYYRGSVETDILSITKKPTLSRYDYSDIVKYVGTRPRIDIYTTDTQVEILHKLLDAYNTEDCDVYWENGTYTFDDIYVYMRDTLGWIWTMGLPLGGNCHYYLNNSTIISDAPSTSYSTSRNIFDVKAVGENFEMYDGILTNNGGTYCVHDDADGADSPFTHIYKNMVFNYVTGPTTQSSSQCVGCGFGVNASYIYDGCIFSNENTESPYDCSFGHGSANSLIKVNITNCYFAERINLMSDLEQTTRALVLYSSNSALAIPQSGNNWEVYAFNNETRS